MNEKRFLVWRENSGVQVLCPVQCEEQIRASQRLHWIRMYCFQHSDLLDDQRQPAQRCGLIKRLASCMCTAYLKSCPLLWTWSCFRFYWRGDSMSMSVCKALHVLICHAQWTLFWNWGKNPFLVSSKAIRRNCVVCNVSCTLFEELLAFSRHKVTLSGGVLI